MPRRIPWLWVGTALLVSASFACGPTAIPATSSPATATAGVDGGTEAIEPTHPPSSTLPPTATASPTAASPADTPTATPVQPEASSCDASGVFAVVDVASDDALNVRSAAGVANPIVGTIPPYGMGVQTTGDGEQVDGALWVPVQFEETNGWVNGGFLACQIGAVDEAVAARAVKIIQALKSRDLETLSRFVHPEGGVRFSPYAYVKVSQGTQGSEDVVFSAAQTRNLFDDLTVHNWGVFDGSGEPMELTFAAYYDRFIYDVDFARPHAVGYGEPIGAGNTINNIAEVYPEAITVEYHFEGFDPQYAGLDWRSLRLVLEEKDGVWYLVGIVHDEWTI